MQEKLKQCAECCHYQTNIRHKKQPRWFDDTCEMLIAKKSRVLHQYRQERSDTNLIAYKQRRSASNRNKHQNIHNKNMLDDLISNCRSPKPFWNKLKQMYNTRQQTANNITKKTMEAIFRWVI